MVESGNNACVKTVSEVTGFSQESVSHEAIVFGLELFLLLLILKISIIY
jgi:hypothetical protein